MRELEPYKAYNFLTKDPVIDEVRTLAEQEYGQRINRKMLKKMELNGGPRVDTMAGWFFKQVRRPSSAGIESAGRSLGFYRPWTRMSPALAAIAKAGRVNKRKKNKRASNGHAKANGR